MTASPLNWAAFGTQMAQMPFWKGGVWTIPLKGSGQIQELYVGPVAPNGNGWGDFMYQLWLRTYIWQTFWLQCGMDSQYLLPPVSTIYGNGAITIQANS